MPAAQSGQLLRQGKGWAVRYRDEHGQRKQHGVFSTKAEANAWRREQVERVAAIQRGDLASATERPRDLDAVADLFLTKHGGKVDPATRRKLEAQLRKARAEFGTRHPDQLRRIELEDWRQTLPAGSRAEVFRALRQCLAWAHERGYVARNASEGISNPRRKRHERRDVTPFETWDEVLAVAAELPAAYRAFPIVAVGTGLRPEELWGLHRADVDRVNGVLRVERRFTGGELKPGGKTPGSVRAVPLRRIVLDALDAHPTRIDTPILFPSARGGYTDPERFRYRVWAPALRAAGLDHRRVNDTRHTFATWAIDGGMHLWQLARIMGTSVGMLEDTYARRLRRADDQVRDALDLYDLRSAHAG
jgi:integrase